MQIKPINQKQNHIKRNQPSFKADIHCVTKGKLKRILKNLPDCFEVGRNGYTIEDAAIGKPSAFTFTACDCVVLPIINPETKLLNMYHLSSSDDNMARLPKISKQIIEQARALKDKSSVKLEGIILGGNDYDLGAPKKFKLLESVRKTFETISKEIGMSYSTLAGRKYRFMGVNVISDATQNAHYINIIDNPFGNCKRFPDFYSLYRYRTISENDTLQIKNRIIAPVGKVSEEPEPKKSFFDLFRLSKTK